MNYNIKYRREIFAIAIPAFGQNVVFSMQQVVDTIMVAGLNIDSVAALSFCAMAFQLVTSALFGIVLAASAFTAQFRGAKNQIGLRVQLYSSIFLGIAVAFIPTMVFVFKPEFIMILSGSNESIIQYGIEYLEIAGWSLLLWPIIVSFGMALNMIGESKFSFYMSAIFVLFSIISNYLFIYGVGWFPELGIKGAALGTLVSDVLFAVLYGIVFYVKKHAFLPSSSEILESLKFGELSKISKKSAPLILSGLAWSGAMFIYHVIYSNHSATSLATIALIAPIITMSLALFNGLATGISANVGKLLGEGDDKIAINLGWYSLRLSFYFGISISVILLALTNSIGLIFPSIDLSTLDQFTPVYIAMALTIWIRGMNISILNGILKAGADNNFTFIIDTVSAWCIALPLCAIGLYLKVPLVVLFLFTLSEELTKFVAGVLRFKTYKWVNKIV